MLVVSDSSAGPHVLSRLEHERLISSTEGSERLDDWVLDSNMGALSASIASAGVSLDGDGADAFRLRTGDMRLNRGPIFSLIGKLLSGLFSFFA